jgi:hypothetical protein
VITWIHFLVDANITTRIERGGASALVFSWVNSIQIRWLAST